MMPFAVLLLSVLPVLTRATKVFGEKGVTVAFTTPTNCIAGSSSPADWSLTALPSHGNLYHSSDTSFSSPLSLSSSPNTSSSSLVYKPTSPKYYGFDSWEFGNDTDNDDCAFRAVIAAAHEVPIANDDTYFVVNDGTPITIKPLLNDEDGANDASSPPPVCIDKSLYSNKGKTSTQGALHFVEVAKLLGVDVHQQPQGKYKDGNCGQEDCNENGYCVPECEMTYMLGGVSIGDVNGDGYEDIIASTNDNSPRIFLNFGDGTFEDITAASGVQGTDANEFSDTTGVAVGDVDNDGDLDIYFSTYGKRHYGYLFINDGSGHFTEESIARGADNTQYHSNTAGVSINIADIDGDGWLDIVTSEWMHEASREFDPGNPGERYESEGFKVLRNRGGDTSCDVEGGCAGYYEDITSQLDFKLKFTAEHREARNGGDPPGMYVFSSHQMDINHDGYPDLVFVLDFGNSIIYFNDGDGGYNTTGYALPNYELGDKRFKPFDHYLSYNNDYEGFWGSVDGLQSGVVNGMGSTIGDANNDGKLDFFLSAISCPHCGSEDGAGDVSGGMLFYFQTKSGNRLYLGGDLTESGAYDELLDDSRTEEYNVWNGGWGWGTSFLDIDNDGDLDLALVNGFDFAGATEDLLATESKLWVNGLNEGGFFEEKGSALGFSIAKSKGRGLVTFDYDYDGDEDIFVMNNEARAELFENRKGNLNGFLKVQVLKHDVPSRSTQIPIIHIKTNPDSDWRMFQSGPTSFYLGTGSPTTHIGLGDDALSDVHLVKITWPEYNNEMVIHSVPRNSLLKVREFEFGSSNQRLTINADETVVVPTCSVLKLKSITQPIEGGRQGLTAKAPDGVSIKYYPPKDFEGEVTFDYTVDNFGLSDIGQITLNVTKTTGEVYERPDKYPPLNGYGNNVEEPTLGCPFMSLHRISNSEYNTSANALLGAYDTPVTEGEGVARTRPSARLISNELFDSYRQDLRSERLNDLHVHMGQMIFHDTDFSTPFASGSLDDIMGIKVPKGDPIFDENSFGGQFLRFRRSGAQPGTGQGFNVNREQFNKVSAFLDLSHVYSPALARLHTFRTFQQGKLTVDGTTGYMPKNVDDVGLANPLEKDMTTQLLSGDNRANVHPALLALHTVFHVEHNRLCDEVMSEIGYAAADEEVFQMARARNIAQWQAHVYEEYLPALLGPKLKLKRYSGYDPTASVGISNEFATAAARFGHSQVNDVQMCANSDYSECEGGHLLLRDNYFKPGSFLRGGMTRLLRGMFMQKAGKVDTKMVDGMRNQLFGTHAFPLDLASINIQRGRDHGLADYNQVREDLGLKRVRVFEEITSDASLAQQLRELYGDDVDNIDLFVGGLAEDHVEGGDIGETFGTIIMLQFEVLRDGDRYYYENEDYLLFTDSQVANFKRRSLCDIFNDVIEYTDGVDSRVEGFCSKDPYTIMLGAVEDDEGWIEKHFQADVPPILISALATLICCVGGVYVWIRGGVKGLDRLGYTVVKTGEINGNVISGEGGGGAHHLVGTESASLKVVNGNFGTAI